MARWCVCGCPSATGAPPERARPAATEDIDERDRTPAGPSTRPCRRAAPGCADCEAAEPPGWWVHLRRCAACGHVGCCDTSPAQHATAHAAGDRAPRSCRASSRARTGSGTTATSRWSTARRSPLRRRGPRDQRSPGPAGAGPGRLARPHPLMTGAAPDGQPRASSRSPSRRPGIPRPPPPPRRGAARATPGAAVRRVGTAARPARRTTPAGLPDGLAVVVGTSGSTGTPKRALLTAARPAGQRAGPRTSGSAAPASGCSRCRRTTSRACRCCCARSMPGPSPVAMDLADGFAPQAFVAATAAARARRAAATRASCPPSCSGCSTTPAGAEALRAFDAVLVGGAALPPRLRRRAERGAACGSSRPTA